MAEDKELSAAAGDGSNGTVEASADGPQDKPADNKVVENGASGDAATTNVPAGMPRPPAKENGSGDKTPEPEQTPAAPVKDMRAVVLSGFGGLKCVKPGKKPEPQGAATPESEVLIKVKACGLSFLDVMARQGALDSPPKPPFIMGFECAGEVVQVGEKVTGFNIGDKVVGLPDHKAWAEYVSVPATSVYVIPEGMSYNDAAAVTMNYTVAYILLFEIANLTPGKSVFVNSIGGGIGQAIVQLARTVKDTTIFGVCHKAKLEGVQAANSVNRLFEKGSDYSSAIRKESPDGVDIVLDSLYGEDCKKGYSLLKPLGKYILYGISNGSENQKLSAARFWWQVEKLAPIKLYDENKTLTGFNFRHLLHQHGKHEFVRSIVNKVFALWGEGKIKPVIDSVYALEDVVEGMQKMQEHKNVGKIILDLSLEPKPKPATPAKSKSKEKKNAAQEEKKAEKAEAENGEKKPELTNGMSEDKSEKSDKSDSDSKGKESS